VTDRRGFPLVTTLLVGASLFMIASAAVMRAALRPVGFQTGWALFVLLAPLALVLLRRARAGSPTLPVHVGLLCAVLYLVHTGLRIPRGGFEIVLTLVSAGVVASGSLAALVVSARRRWRASPEPPRFLDTLESGCARVCVPLTYCLLALALLHGVLAHAHGLLARVLGLTP